MEDNIFNHTESTTPFFTGTPTGDTVGEINERAENENMFLVSLLFVAGAVAILVTTVFCVIYRNKIDVCLNNCGWGPPTTKQMMLRRKRRRLSSSTESTSTQPQSPSRFSFRNGLSGRVGHSSQTEKQPTGFLFMKGADKINTRSTLEETPLQKKQRRRKFVAQNVDLRLKGEDDLACHVCLVEFESSETLAYSQNPKCNHTYHPRCIVSWLSEHRGCPICQKSFFDTELEQSFKDQAPRCMVIQQPEAEPQQQDPQEDSHEQSESDKEILSSSLATRVKSVDTNDIECVELNEDTGDDIERCTAITNDSVDNETTKVVAKSGASVTSSKASSSKHSHSSSSKASSKDSRSSRQSEESSSSSSRKSKRQQRREKSKAKKSHNQKSFQDSNMVESGDAKSSVHSSTELESTHSSQERPSIEKGVSSDEEESSGIHSFISRKSATSKSSSSKRRRQEKTKHSKSTNGDTGDRGGEEERDDISAVSETLSKMLGPLLGSSSGSVSTRSSDKSKGKSTNSQSVYGTLLDNMDDDDSHYDEERDIFDEFMERGEIDNCSLESCGTESEDDNEQEEKRDDVSTVSESAQSGISRFLAPIRMLGPFSSDNSNNETTVSSLTPRQDNRKISVDDQDRSLIPLDYSLSVDEDDSVGVALVKQKEPQIRQQNGVRDSINLTRKISGEGNGFTTLIPLKYVSSIRKEQRKYHGAVYIPSTEEDGEMPSHYV